MSEESRYCVYCHTNKTNGKKYIGITKQSPSRRWRKGQAYKDNSYFYNSICKYTWEGFDHSILFTDLSEADAKETEIKLIAQYNTIYPNGYNFSTGGESYNCSDVTREKIRKSATGRKHTEESKQKMSKSRTGSKNHFYGKHHTKESINKIKTAKVGIKSGGKQVYCDGMTFDSLNDCAKYYNDSAKIMSAWITGKLKMPLIYFEKNLHYVSESHPIRPQGRPNGGEVHNAKKIICVTTGENFDAIIIASKFYSINRQTIRKNCQGISNYGGKDNDGNLLQWKYYDDYIKERGGN